MEFIENVRSRTTEEGADISVVYKSDSLGFSTDAGKRFGLFTGAEEVKDAKGNVVKEAQLPSKILVAPASDGDLGYNEKGEEIDLAGQLIILVTNGKMEVVAADGKRRALQPFQLNTALKGNPKTMIDRLAKEFNIGTGEYKSIAKEDKTGLAVLKPGSKKALKDADIEDVVYEVKEDVNDFTLTIVEKIVSFKLASGGTLDGCFGLLVELHEETSPKDDRVIKQINHRKAKKLGLAVPSNEEAAAGMPEFVKEEDEGDAPIDEEFEEDGEEEDGE
jgi:hypothetical protein